MNSELDIQYSFKIPSQAYIDRYNNIKEQTKGLPPNLLFDYCT